MLHEFLAANRADLIDRCRLKVAQRRAPKPTDAELEHGIPHFLDQLIKTLRVEQTHRAHAQPQGFRPVGRRGLGPVRDRRDGGAARARADAARASPSTRWCTTTATCARRSPTWRSSATRRSRSTSSARSTAAWTTRSPTRSPNSPTSAICCSRTPGSQALNERLGFFAHELRNLIQTATLAVTAHQGRQRRPGRRDRRGARPQPDRPAQPDRPLARRRADDARECRCSAS